MSGEYNTPHFNLEHFLIIYKAAENDLKATFDIFVEVYKWKSNAKIEFAPIDVGLLDAKKRQKMVDLAISRNLAPEMIEWLASSPTLAEKKECLHELEKHLYSN